MAKRKPSAETFRLRALAYLTARNLSRARLEIKKALELEPRWISNRSAAAMIDYYSALSPAMLPGRPVPWPEPVDWFLVRRDDESLQRLRDAAEVFQELSRTQTRNAEERRMYEAWHLACLANDPEKQEQAADYCRGILQNDLNHYGAIVWAIARNYLIDLAPSAQSLESLVVSGSATISHITALLSYYLAAGRAPDAINLLEQTHALFSQYDADAIWTFWRVQALMATGDPNAALAVIDTENSGVELRDARATALRLIAKTTGDWQPVIQHLERSYEETKNPGFLLEACEIMAQQQNWTYVADRAEQMVQEMETSEVVRLAAIAVYNTKRFELCLKFLDGYRNRFKNGQLPGELRELRISCQHALGILPEAISEAETLAQEAPTTQNLYRLAQLFMEKGDLKNVAIVARRLSDHPDLLAEQAFQIAGLIRWDDLPLAQILWRKVAFANLPDSLVGAAIGLGYQLGLDKELKPLVERMTELGQKGQGGVQVMSVDELIAFAKQDTGRIQAIEESYRTGAAPTHAIAELVNQPLVSFYHGFLAVNEINPDPLRQNYLMARHGGRALIEGLWKTPPTWRLNLDVSAVLLANHLGILPNVEQVYAPLHIPAELVPTLLYMRDKVAHHQPSRFQAYRQIVELVQRGLLTISNSKLPSDYQNTTLVEELGEDWVALIENARANHGYVVDFLPLRKRDLSGPPTALPADAQNYVINCRSVVDALRAQGPFSDAEYKVALEELGQEGLHSPSQVIPQEGAPLYFDRGILEVLAGANVLAIACQHFQVKIEQQELDGIRAALHYEDNIQSADNWLSVLIDRIRDGIDRGIYQIIPIPRSKAGEPEESVDSHPYTDCTRPLLLFEPHEGDAIWIDDRFFNGHFHRDSIPIIGVNEVLKALVSASVLSISEYYEKLHRLRAANVRFIPLEADEILYCLQQARIEDDAVVETGDLSVLRRYIATCLLQGNSLQRPTPGVGTPNPEGETAFALGLSHAISNALAKVWDAEEDKKVCEARSNWLMSNLFLDHLGLLNLTALRRPEQDDRYIVGISLAGLILQALQLQSDRDKSSSSPRKRYLEWLYEHIVYSRLKSDPLLSATVADLLKKAMSDSKEELMTGGHEQVAMILIQEFFENLPEPIRNEVSRDDDFMASIGFKFTIDIAGVRFDPNTYWRAAAEAVNGREVPIVAAKPLAVVTFEPKRISDEQIGFCFEHPTTGLKVPVVSTDYQLLLESSIEQEKFLRRNSAWFDCPRDVFERAIAEVVSTKDPAQRLDKVAAWRNTSAAVYYDELETNLTEQHGFNFGQLIPDSSEGLLRHFHLTVRTPSAEASFQDTLATAAKMLIEQNGLQGALERFVRLPLALPRPLLEMAASLPPHEIRATIKSLIGKFGSPVSQLHCLHLLSRFSDKVPSFRRLARRIITHLISDQGAQDFEAFRAILRWVNIEFQYWSDFPTWPASVRLAIVWAHSHQLFAIFSPAGVPRSWIVDHFGPIGRSTPSEVFGRDPDYWFDVAHPRRVGFVQFALTGLAYAIGDDGQLAGDETLRQLFNALAFHYSDGRRLPDLLLLQDVTQATNSLGSFLGGDRAEALSNLLTPDDVSSFAQPSLKGLVEGAIDALTRANADHEAWATIYAVLGDFAPDEILIDRLLPIIQQTRFADLFVEDWHWGNLALQAASAQAYYSEDEAIHQHLKNELKKIAKSLAARGSPRESASDESDLALPAIEGFLFEAALKISLANPVPGNAPTVFGEIISNMVDVWPALGSTAMIVVQQLYERLPIHQAKQLHVSLVRLRAMNERGI